MQAPALEKEAAEITGRINATDVMHNIIDLAIAQLLSNPRLPDALDARLHREAN
jgi:hypothetical protein